MRVCVQHSSGQHEGFKSGSKSCAVTKDLTEVVVAPDTYHVSPEPMLLVADLHGALALCLHDEGRGVGGLLHLKFMGGTGRPSDVTDNTLSSVLVVLDRFKRGVLGNSSQARRHPGAHPGPCAAADRTSMSRARRWSI